MKVRMTLAHLFSLVFQAEHAPKLEPTQPGSVLHQQSTLPQAFFKCRDTQKEWLPICCKEELFNLETNNTRQTCETQPGECPEASSTSRPSQRILNGSAHLTKSTPQALKHRCRQVSAADV